MIDMDVCRHGKDGFAGGNGQHACKVTEAHAEINDEIGITADDVEHVGPKEGVDMRFVYPGQPIRDRFR
ncbi:hypothetical protein GCM10007923_38070 [Shinella yambaruensis]|uniref:Uncharacterized protein n=1 Tax=Shinella yambaruensis TaxID=415996 RepID=A0ABQ5ZP14_9HYPH|nr:hypothetical protein GCM10007923_38070 [Shinella yambaruensis]